MAAIFQIELTHVFNKSCVLAAAGIIPIGKMTKRLAKDHANARLLASLLNELDGVSVDLDAVQVNMVFVTFDWPDLSELNLG